MIYWLFQDYFSHHDRTLRIGMAAMLSFLIVLLLGPFVIRYLVRKKVGDRPEFYNVALNELTKHKSNTPTMGGVLIVVAIFLSVLMFADLKNFYIRMGLFTIVWLSVLGGLDDWVKLQRAKDKEKDKEKSNRDGLVMWIKMVFQVGLAVLLSVYIYAHGDQSPVPTGEGESTFPAHNFYLPFIAVPLVLGPLWHAIITTLTMVGSSNAVNLTDGMDGLAAGCVIIVAGVLLILSWVVGMPNLSLVFNVGWVRDSLEMTVLCSAIVGACLGFMWYNANPAQVFMGDTGSLTLGGLLGYVAVVTRQEVVLFIAGGVFVMEAMSVILQVTYFKATKHKSGQGKRLFRCAPLHHHFHMGGLAETKVVARFWILGIIFAMLAMATLKLKW